MRTSKQSSPEIGQMQLGLFDHMPSESFLPLKDTARSQQITISFCEAAERFARIRRQEIYKSIAQMATHIK
jgi:hypothetical protein